MRCTRGVFQVVVPKALVTEPLEPGWKQSAINVPSPDTIASYRKGRYHAHETVSEYRVHMDRYDPEKNPIMHLIDDAPLALMLHETMETVFVTGKDATRRDPLQRLADQHMTWKFRMGLGIVLVAIGVTLLLTAFYGTLSFFAVTLPALVLILGLIAITKGVQQRNRKEHADKDIIRGGSIVRLQESPSSSSGNFISSSSCWSSRSGSFPAPLSRFSGRIGRGRV
ncbi:hypothetical protein [Methanoculleus chikugoensis]|uniref:hypothetical protein n=1 Tax=Methanoculleus chikugoensis TaxID=118126 RepID=UPI0006D2480E|nr:hypothetical protein [Methanoculleus chikugoensis]